MKKAAFTGIAGFAAPSAAFGLSPNSETKSMIRPKVLFFDVNESLLDLAIIKKSVGKALGGREDLVPLWFTTMLQYSLVETTGRHRSTL